MKALQVSSLTTFNNDFMMNWELNFSVTRNDTYLLVNDPIFKSKLSRSSCRNEILFN